ncbi:MAG: ribonuclease P protein component [Geobacter sp.]|nr:ribonuclease P protein component [Geobacter sp.]
MSSLPFPVSECGACFPKQFRLLSRSEYLRLSDSTTVVSGRSFLVIWKQNDCTHPRLGITASKKTGNAVVRNRLKRIVREFFRHHCTCLPGVDLNVIVRRQAAEKSTTVLFTELHRAFQQIGSPACCHDCS